MASLANAILKSELCSNKVPSSLIQSLCATSAALTISFSPDFIKGLNCDGASVLVTKDSNT